MRPLCLVSLSWELRFMPRVGAVVGSDKKGGEDVGKSLGTVVASRSVWDSSSIPLCVGERERLGGHVAHPTGHLDLWTEW